MPDVLIAFPGDGGLAGCEEGRIVASDDVRGHGGRRLPDGDRYGPVKTWLRGARAPVGGSSARGAPGVELVELGPTADRFRAFEHRRVSCRPGANHGGGGPT